MSNINGFEILVLEKKIFYRFVKMSPFLHLKCPLKVQPLDLSKSKSPYSRDASYQIGMKAI